MGSSNYLNIDKSHMLYDAMIGVGGIGSGSFFALSGNHTLGREESRGGHFLDRRDYCKLHIISHYVRTLLGPSFAVIPVGKVGGDDVGRRLVEEMREAGLSLEHVEVSEQDRTLFSFCLVYPDGGGGNLTTDNSACSKVDGRHVERAAGDFARFQGRGVALAVPEVPLHARAKLLELASEHGFFRVASFTSEEIGTALEEDLLAMVDLLAANLDEASVIAGTTAEKESLQTIVKAAVDRLTSINSDMLVSITAGGMGSWSADASGIRHAPVHNVEARSTAGAGDAHLSGIIAGLSLGLPLGEAQELGSLVAALSVTSPHTIHKGICRQTLRELARSTSLRVCDSVMELLGD